MKKVISYVIWIILIISLAVSYSLIFNSYIRGAYIMHYITLYQKLMVFVFHMLFGVIIGMPLLLEKLNNPRKWKIDVYKLIIVGIPALLLSQEVLLLI